MMAATTMMAELQKNVVFEEMFSASCEAGGVKSEAQTLYTAPPTEFIHMLHLTWQFLFSLRSIPQVPRRGKSV